MTTVTYTPDYATNFSNPERGFLIPIVNGGNFTSGNLNTYKAQGMSLIWYELLLSSFKASALSGAFLTQMQAELDAIKAAKMKCIMRFRYTLTDTVDAPLSVIQGHLDQLQPYFAANSGIILAVQGGFIGQWGEFQGSTNFGSDAWPPSLSTQDKANRKAVIDKLLAVVPANRYVQVRQPWIKTQFYSTTPLADASRYSQTDLARLGHFNDCFLEGVEDGGTYIDPANEKPYLAVDSRWTLVGGETCGLDARTVCSTALSELNQFHWTFLNSDYNTDVLAQFQTGGCYPEIQQRLGYRVTLVSATLPANATAGSAMAVAFSVLNVGFAPPLFRPKMNLVLRNGGTTVRIPMVAKPRDWWTDGQVNVSENVTLPSNMAAGTWTAALEIPDEDTALAADPAYSMRLANTDSGFWESGTGLNNLGMSVIVAASGVVAPVIKSRMVNASLGKRRPFMA